MFSKRLHSVRVDWLNPWLYAHVQSFSVCFSAFESNSTSLEIMTKNHFFFADENRDEDKQFLTDLSDQNYSKFNVDLPSSGTNRYWHREVLRYRRGKTYTITSTNVNEISLTSIAVLADIWYEKDNMRETHIQIHEPVYDSTAKGMHKLS